jgi:uncharacterized 2Fe-2S/4Fe-4S cluster protein (DUF4445 family)
MLLREADFNFIATNYSSSYCTAPLPLAKIIFMNIHLTTGHTIEAQEGESLLGALKRNDIFLVASCGGKGTCGKCRVRVISGDCESSGTGKLTKEDIANGLSLACTTVAKGDLHLEIPATSRLVVGDKIAFAKAEELQTLLASFDVTLSPVLETAELHLPAPSLDDNISDMERLKRALEEHGACSVKFSHGFTLQMAEALRKPQWKVMLGYIDEPGSCEAVFITNHEDDTRYAVAVDIGTTTVVVYLVDLKDGHLVDVGSTYNSQMRFGDDVITRIVHATEGGGLNELKRAVVSDINEILKVIYHKHNIDADDVETLCISGNTTMVHLFWGLDPGSIREEPYIPTLNAFPLWKAGTAKLNANPQAPVYTLPCVASYVGGDIVSGVLASKMHREEPLTLFMDIGTNGEIAFGNKEWIVTAACSAGPCFEGSGVRHGMRATEGAVEGVTIDPDTKKPTLKVIGDGRPVGICGSGMIDAISEMFITGVLDQKGKFVSDLDGAPVRKGEDGMEYVFYEDQDGAVSLAEVDIENLLRAKAAIYAGANLLVTEMGMTLQDVERVYIAGGFGSYLNIKKAIIMGMLPDLPQERFSYLGNTSVAGAYLSLLSRELRQEAQDIASMMTYMELSVSSNFMDEYMSALFLPHTDMTQFPTVAKLLQN